MPSGEFTQDNRFLSLSTPLGKDVLLLNSYTISERISAPYRMELDVLHKGIVDPKKLLGQPVSFSTAYSTLTGRKRDWHGIVTEVGMGNETERFRRFRLVVMPSLWLTTLSVNFRAFESKTVPDIVKEVLAAYKIQTRWELTATYTKWDFCFQYRETDFNFLSRLLEHEGIFYFFEHAAGSHTMVIADSPASFKASPDQPSVNYAPDIGAGGEDFVTDWELSHSLGTGSYRLWDWHFEKPAASFSTNSNTAESVAGNTSWKISDYPGRFIQQFNKIDSVNGASKEGNKLSDIRMEELESANPVYRATSFCRAFNTGQRFSLAGGTRPGDYVLIRIEHAGAQYPPYLSGMESPLLYTNSLECIPWGRKFRPPRTAERSLAQGPQTATVSEGPDKYGRMRVRFHWGDNTASAWLRVAQRWAGPQWGSIFLPRPGHEVIIEFLDGDPDHPVIVGSLYNARNMPPYALPEHYTQSGVKTRSMSPDGSTQGSADEFNELRFEDKQGKEDIYFHAQKDFHRVVENDDDLQVGNDQTISVGNNRTEVVKKGDEKVTVEMGDRDVSIDMGNDTLTVKMGNHIRKISLGKSETEALQSITLKVGANSIKIDQMGITLDGLIVQTKGQIMVKSQAPLQQMSGDAMVMIKGGITMIN